MVQTGNKDLEATFMASVRAFPEQVEAAVNAFAHGNDRLATVAQNVALAWSCLAYEGIERSLRMAMESSKARTVPEMAEIQARLLRETMDAVAHDPQRITQLLLACVRPPEAEATPDLATRAMRSGLAHAGEPPDYDADYEGA